MLHKYGHMEESPFVFDQARRSMIGSKSASQIRPFASADFTLFPFL
jgi:hypothetical protein